MLFQTFEFLIFFPTVFLLFWIGFKKSFKKQNILILISSYVFYGWWDWRFLSLVFISSISDFILGQKICSAHSRSNHSGAKLYLIISLAINLGILGFFKYFNFFIATFNDLANSVGFETHVSSLQIILPVGISFYTFQTLSYSIDIYKRRIMPTKDVVAFLSFVSFFPQLVAGPIERASNLLPQFLSQRNFKIENVKDGLLQVLAGLFKKLVIADTCALYVDLIFQSPEVLSGSVLFLGSVYFAFQIYGDFSGYSDIAIGASKMLGFDLMTNFKTPYFSRDIAEFWRRWHVSLSSWFRDYLYIPLGGNRGSKVKVIRNIIIVFVVSGFWHGANWTFVFWGLLHALYFLPLQILRINRTNIGKIAGEKWLPNFKEVIQMLMTFVMVCFAWIFFRAQSLSDAFLYLESMLNSTLFSFPNQYRAHLPLLIGFVLIEWIFRRKRHILQVPNNLPSIIRWSYYYLIFIITSFFISEEPTKFIYFDF